MTMRLRISLCAASGLLLGFSFPPFETGMLAAAGFVPLLILLSTAGSYGSVFRASYAAFFIFNLVALYWPGGFVHGKDVYLMISGALLIVAHPLFMCLPMLVFHGVRKSLGLTRSVVIFPLIWVAFEYAHSLTQLSFPWLILGNTQTYNLSVIQVASVTGVYGLSFWLLCINVLFLFLFSEAAGGHGPGRGKKPAALIILGIIAVYSAPYAAAAWIPPYDEANGGRLSVTLIQPDIDPFEKWGGRTDPQVATLEALTDSALAGGARPDVVVWPETAIPYYILSPVNAPGYLALREYVAALGVPLLSGIPDIVYYPDSADAPRGAKALDDGTRYETFNSSMLLVPGSDAVQKYPKSLLVPFAERVPYSDVLAFLDAARWNFGLGGWSPGRDTALLRLPPGGEGRDTVAFANLICYESIYPGYVAGLVRRGARFLTVITNDSWWGNTAGPYQHMQFAVLRAVENRRWIVQCANGGISFVIDPAGRIVSRTDLFTRTALSAHIGTPEALTPYSRHGDWFAEGCLVVTIFLWFAAMVHRLFRRKMGHS